MSRLSSSLLAFPLGCLLFFVVFVCAVNGYPRAMVAVALAYLAVGFVLGRENPAGYRFHLVLLLLPAVPLVGLFLVRFLDEGNSRSALQWMGILIAVVVLAFSGGVAGAFSQGRGSSPPSGPPGGVEQ